MIHIALRTKVNASHAEASTTLVRNKAARKPNYPLTGRNEPNQVGADGTFLMGGSHAEPPMCNLGMFTAGTFGERECEHNA